MPDRKTIYDGLSCAARGYFFLYFNINLGNVSILPSFVGYLLLLSAIGSLQAVRRELALLRTPGRLLALYKVAEWALSWVGTQLPGHVPFLDLVENVLVIYFHFQLLTDLAALAQAFQPEGETFDHRLLRRRTQSVLLATAVTLLYGQALSLPERWLEWLLMVLALAYCIVALAIMLALFELRRCIPQDPEIQPPAEA